MAVGQQARHAPYRWGLRRCRGARATRTTALHLRLPAIRRAGERRRLCGKVRGVRIDATALPFVFVGPALWPEDRDVAGGRPAPAACEGLERLPPLRRWGALHQPAHLQPRRPWSAAGTRGCSVPGVSHAVCTRCRPRTLAAAGLRAGGARAGMRWRHDRPVATPLTAPSTIQEPSIDPMEQGVSDGNL